MGWGLSRREWGGRDQWGGTGKTNPSRSMRSIISSHCANECPTAQGDTVIFSSSENQEILAPEFKP